MMVVDPPSGFRSLSFLIASEHEFTRDLLHFALEAFQAEDIREAANGWSALRMAGEIMPDVVLVDMDLPAVGAPELVRCIRTALLHRELQPAVLVFTHRPREDGVFRAMKSGADDILRLPFSASFLSRRIVRALANHAGFMPGFRPDVPSAPGRTYRPATWPTVEKEEPREAGPAVVLTQAEILALTSPSGTAP